MNSCLIANLSFDAVTIDEYFVGAGDINAGHLPKQDAVIKSEPAPSTVAAPTTELVKESTEAKSDPSDTSVGTTETALEIETSTTSPIDATAAPADTTTTASSGETSEEKKPEEKGEELKAEVTASVMPTSGKPLKVLKPKAPVMDDNDNELKHILEVRLCCFWLFSWSRFSLSRQENLSNRTRFHSYMQILETIHEKFYDDREVFKLTKPKKQPDVKVQISSTGHDNNERYLWLNWKGAYLNKLITGIATC